MSKKENLAEIVKDYEKNSLNYLGEGSKLHQNRKTILDYYYCKKFGTEVPGMSEFVSSDVSDVIEGMLPNLLKLFFQSQNFGEFTSTQITGNLAEFEKELDQRTAFANWVFNVQNDGFKIFHDFLKDGLLQYVGVVEVFYEEKEKRKPTYFSNATLEQVQLLKAENPIVFEDYELEKNDDGTFDITSYVTEKYGYHKIENVAPEEFLISKNSRDFVKPAFIGRRSRVTRSDLIKMGFKRSIVDKLKDDNYYDEELQIARSVTNEEIEYHQESRDKSQDLLWLGKYYCHADLNNDGMSEYYEVFYCGGEVLDFEEVEDHPFAAFTPIPVGSTAIGTCPADQVADLQYLKSELVRQGLTNVYSTNFNRFLFNNRANPDHLFTVKHGGGIHVDDTMPVSGVVEPLAVLQQVPEILTMIQYVDSMIEKRTGITSYNQGLDTDSLNKTATGFKGVRDLSQMRIELIARHAATAAQRIFEIIDANARKFQNEELEIRVSGEPMKFSPKSWGCDANFSVDVGLGSGDRQEKMFFLNHLLDKQIDFMDRGLPLSDPASVHNLLDKMCLEAGLKQASPYFNDPTKPMEVLQAENFQMQQQIAAMQQQLEMQNPLAEQARIEQETEAFKSQLRMSERQMDIEHKEKVKNAEMLQKADEFSEKQDLEITKLEMQYNKDLLGGLDERRQAKS